MYYIMIYSRYKMKRIDGIFYMFNIYSYILIFHNFRLLQTYQVLPLSWIHPKLDGDTILMKTPHTGVTRDGETTLVAI